MSRGLKPDSSLYALPHARSGGGVTVGVGGETLLRDQNDYNNRSNTGAQHASATETCQNCHGRKNFTALELRFFNHTVMTKNYYQTRMRQGVCGSSEGGQSGLSTGT